VKVLVAGATGALGEPLIGALRAAGHEVSGTTRSAERVDAVRALGAEPLVADALDARALERALLQAAPEAVVHALTAYPPAGPRRAADTVATNELRERGTANLIAASTAAGVRRLVTTSFALVYGMGDLGTAPLAEDAPLRDRAPKAFAQPTLDALRSMERQVLDATTDGRLEGVVLRHGGWYAPGATGTEAFVAELRRRRVPLIGGAPGLMSWVHLDDAVSATVHALEDPGASGSIFNVSDDEPVSWGEFFGAAARVVGAPAPRRIPAWLGRVVAPYATLLMSDTNVPLSNAAAKRAWGWQPRYPTYREGLAGLAAAR
jgi:nucleoside-diphosphate-sugar epimerase